MYFALVSASARTRRSELVILLMPVMIEKNAAVIDSRYRIRRIDMTLIFGAKVSHWNESGCEENRNVGPTHPPVAATFGDCGRDDMPGGTSH